MGASESKLVFKQGIFRLSEEQNIAANDPYWTGVRHCLWFILNLVISKECTDLVYLSSGSYPNLPTMSSAFSQALTYAAPAMPPDRTSRRYYMPSPPDYTTSKTTLLSQIPKSLPRDIF
jgi:hypothetical protein